MFIRKKKIKGIEYAYLVKNKYNKKVKQSRQKSSQYLGKIIKLDFQGNPIKAHTIKSAIIQSLKNLNFEQKDSQLIKGKMIIDLKNQTVINSNKPLCLELNQGYLCNYTLKKLINFKPKNTTNIEIAKDFASIFVNAGINIDQESFVSIFNEKFKNIKD